MRIAQEISEYSAWLIRNSYKETGLRGDDVDCHNFKLLINGFQIGIENGGLPDQICGLEVLTGFPSSTAIDLLVRPEDISKQVNRFMKAFHELQELYPFNDCQVWRKECHL